MNHKLCTLITVTASLFLELEDCMEFKGYSFPGNGFPLPSGNRKEGLL